MSKPTIAVLVVIAACLLMLRGRKHVVGTTLVGPWCWLAGSLFVLATTHAVAFVAVPVGTVDEATWRAPVLFAAAVTSFCPLMSLLGAKRPQDRGWHFVVISLWAILLLPVAESLVLRHGAMPDVEGARSWFMLILIVLGIVNALPTKFWIAGAMFGAGQVSMLADTLPMFREMVHYASPSFGLALCACGAIVMSLLAGRRYRGDSFDAVWRDFRDNFGLLWALRVREQINITARSSEWPFTLRWHGFVNQDGSPLDVSTLSESNRREFEQLLSNLLRRFVSKEWIASRTEEAID